MKKNLRNGPVLSPDRLRKLFMTMKLTFILTVCLVYGLSANVLSQQKVSMDIREATLKEVLDEFQRQTGTIVFYSSDKLETSRKVRAVFNEVEVQTFLTTVLSGCRMSFRILDDYILIIPSENEAQPQTKEITIRGKVSDKTRQPLPGATVLIKGTSFGAATDANGEYRLTFPEQEDVVFIFSFIGMKSRELAYAGQTELNVTLEEEELEVDEVVVTGMFTRKANTYTGSVVSIKSEELKRVGNANLINSLKSLDPSFMVVENLQAGSNPNALPDIQMRGQTGLSNIGNEYQHSANQPLFILDGFETTLTKILDLDMNMVESVTLLKDATAKAMYGSKAANGVVVIELIRPAKGQMKINYTGSLDIQAPDLASYDLLNASEKIQAEINAGFYTSDNAQTQINLNQMLTELRRQVEAGVDTYWLSKPLRVGTGHKHSLYLEGGDDHMLYGVDLSYQGVTGVMKGSDRKTVSGGVTLSYRKENLIFRNKLSVDGNQSEDSPYGSFALYTLLNPYNEMYDEQGQLPTYYANGLVSQVNYLKNGEINTTYQDKYTYIADNFYAEWYALENFRVIARFGFSHKNTTEIEFKPAGHTDFYNYSVDNVHLKGSYSAVQRKDNSLSADLGVAGSLYRDKHMLSYNVQGSISQNKYDYYVTGAQGFANNNMDHISFAVQFTESKPLGSEGVSRDIGGVASVNYSYDDRYLFDGNYRLSGSSEFGANKRWGHFYSVGAGWNLHNEKFMESLEWISRMKLRVSTGYTGSQGFNSYDAITTLNYYSAQQYNGAIGSYLQGLANPNLKWQRKYDTNLGMDVTLFKNRFNLRFDYYVGTTKGLITPVTAPQSTGFSQYYTNLGEMENKGVEAYLSGRVWEEKATGNFLNLYLSVASNKNTLTKISNSLKQYNDEQDSEADADASYTSLYTRYEEGKSTSAIWVVKSLGIDPQTGKEVFVKKDGSLTNTWSSADYIDGGNTLPKVNGIFGINMEYKGFGINAAFNWRLGGQMYNTTLVSKVENADARNNVDKRVFTDRWVKPGDVVRFKAIADNSYTQPTSRFVEDYNMLQMSSLNISYDFRNTRLVKGSFLNRLKAVFYMNDLFIISSVKTERGTDYPFARTFSFSLQASF